MKNILYINDVTFTSGSGEITHTVGVLNALDRLGFEITYLTFENNKKILLEYGLSTNINVLYSVSFGGSKLSRILYFLILLFRPTSSFDYIYARDSIFTFLLYPLILFRNNVRLVLEYNGVREYELKSVFFKKINYLISSFSRLVANRAHANVAVATGIENYIRKYQNIHNVITINNGSNLSRDCDYVRQDISDLPKVIVFVGNISVWQNFDLLISLVLSNRDFLADNSLVFHLYGDGVELPRLKQVVVDLKLEDIIIFKGKIANHLLPAVLSSCRAGLLIDKRYLDGFPLFSPLKMYEYNLFDLPSVFISDEKFEPLQAHGYYLINGDNFGNLINILSKEHQLASSSRSWDDVAKDFLNKVFV